MKRIGTPRNPAQQEPVWTGTPVNFAAKAAQCADRHQLVVTCSVWDRIESNDYLAFSCSCKEPSREIWKDFTIERLRAEEREREGKRLTSIWCEEHGEDYCSAILEGRTNRPEVRSLRDAIQRTRMQNAIGDKAEREQQERHARREGLSP